MKKVSFISMIVALVISSIIGITIVLADEWNPTTAKLLFSSLIVFSFSIPSLLCVLLYERDEYKIFSLCGIVTCLISIVYCLFFTWFITDVIFNESLLKILVTLIVLSELFGYVCFILLMKTNEMLVKGLKIASISLATLLSAIILEATYFNPVNYKIIFVLSVLITLCTLLVPIMNKLIKNNKQLTSVNDNSLDNYQKLEQLKKLYDNNVLSEEEYNREKNRILSNNN